MHPALSRAYQKHDPEGPENEVDFFRRERETFYVDAGCKRDTNILNEIAVVDKPLYVECTAEGTLLKVSE
jgi:hypothetical protein